MGITLGLDQDTGKDCPYWFSRTNSEDLGNYLVLNRMSRVGLDRDVVGLLEQYLELDLRPLQKVALGELPLDDYIEIYGDDEVGRIQAALAADKHREENEAAWQSPDVLGASLRTLVTALDNNPRVYVELGVLDPYFIRGLFHQDLVDLLRMTEWARQNGAHRVRLVAR